MKLAILLLGAAVLHAQEPAPNSLKLLAISDAAMVASDVGDILSSRGLYELNPLVGRGPFGARQDGISLGLTAAIVLAEIPLVRKWPKLGKAFAIANFAQDGAHGIAAVHNWRQQ